MLGHESELAGFLTVVALLSLGLFWLWLNTRKHFEYLVLPLVVEQAAEERLKSEHSFRLLRLVLFRVKRVGPCKRLLGRQVD